MKRPAYRDAIFWITRNDDMHEIRNNPETPWLIVECIVADLFGVETEKVRKDVSREIAKMDAEQAKAVQA